MVQRSSRGIGHDLDDAVQETLLRMLTVDVARFDPAFGVAGFAATRAMWTVRDLRRREAARGRIDGRFVADAVANDEPSPEAAHLARLDEADTASAVGTLRLALAELDDDTRAVIEAHDLHERPLRELARERGQNVSSLSRRREKGLRRLARRLR